MQKTTKLIISAFAFVIISVGPGLFDTVEASSSGTYSDMECFVSQLGSGLMQPRRDNVYQNLGLTVPTNNPIARYRIQRFDGNRSDWYTVGSGDLDRKDNCGDQYYLWGNSWDPIRPLQCSRRVWSYFADHVHQIECWSTTGTGTTGTGTTYSGSYGYGYMPGYGYGYGYGYKIMNSSEKPYLYLLKPMIRVSKSVYEQFKSLDTVLTLSKGFDVKKLFDLKTLESMKQEMMAEIKILNEKLSQIADKSMQTMKEVAQKAISDFDAMINTKAQPIANNKPELKAQDRQSAPITFDIPTPAKEQTVIIKQIKRSR